MNQYFAAFRAAMVRDDLLAWVSIDEDQSPRMVSIDFHGRNCMLAARVPGIFVRTLIASPETYPE